MILAEMTSPEIDALPRDIVVLMPVASCEQHSLHLPVFTDSMIGGEVALRTHRLVPDDVLVLPVQWLGYSQHHIRYPGTLSAVSETHLVLMMDTVASMAAHGFKKFLIQNSHGGNGANISVLLQRPDSARARPGTVIKDDDDYDKMFSLKYDMGLYEACAELNFVIDKFFRDNRKTIDSIYRNNLKFHTMMVLAWELTETTFLKPKLLAKIDFAAADTALVEKTFNWVKAEFDSAGAEDATAKDNKFVTRLKSSWQAEP